MKRSLHILLFLLPICLISCRKSAVAGLLDDIESYIQARPDSAIIVLSQIDTATLHTPKELAQFSLLQAIALDKNFIDTTDVSVIQPAVEYYQKHGTPYQKMLTFYYEGRILYNARRDAEAIICQMHALENAKITNPDRYLGLIYASMADLSSRSYCWEETAICIQQAKDAFLSVNDSLSYFVSIEKELTNLSNQDKKLEALVIIDSLINNDCIPKELFNDFLLIRAGMMVDTSHVDYFPALSCYIEALQNGARPTIKQRARYAYALAHCGYEKEANLIFTAIRETNKAGAAIAETKLQQLLADQGQYEEAYHMLRESLQYQDEKVNEILTQSLFRNQREFLREKEKGITIQNKYQQSAIIILILTLIITAKVIGFLISHYRRKTAAQELEMEQLAETIGTIINEKDRNYSDLKEQFRQIHQEQLKLLEKYYKDYEFARRTGAGEKELYGKLLAIIKDIEGDADGQRYLDTLIDEQYEGIMRRLYSECPNLTKQDYLLFSYSAAGFERATIGMLLGNLSADAIHMRRSRLRKAIRAINPPSIQDFLNLIEMR